MSSGEEKLLRFMSERGLAGEHLRFEHSCHSVAEAARAANASPADFVKNVCFVDASGSLVVAIVKGEDRADAAKTAAAAGSRVKIASPQEVVEKTGFESGGTPSFGFNALFLVDERVLEKKFVYTSGGSANSLLKIAPAELLRANAGRVLCVHE